MADSTDSWLDDLPKVELHLHLEGAIPHPALWELVRKYDASDEVPSLEALIQRFRFRDFPHFIETWNWKNGFLREYDDFTFIAEAVAEDLSAQNVHYAEVFFSPPDFARHGLTPQRLAEAIRRGLDRVPATTVRLVADLVRDFGPRKGAETLGRVAEVRELGVVGIGIGGSEHDHPASRFAEVFEHARELGFRTSAHAGEAAGADSVRQAIDDLRVDRVGHATRAAEDPRLLDELAERSIPLEMCPISNVCTGVVDSLDAHPVARFLDRGLRVTVNTDDPSMFGNTLAMEYRSLQEVFGFEDELIRDLVRTAALCSWQSEDRRNNLVRSLQEDPAWQRADASRSTDDLH